MFSIQNIRVTPDGNVGLQLTGDSGGGIYLVQVIPRGTLNWYNTNWEQDLGGGWIRLYED